MIVNFSDCKNDSMFLEDWNNLTEVFLTFYSKFNNNRKHENILERTGTI